MLYAMRNNLVNDFVLLKSVIDEDKGSLVDAVSYHTKVFLLMNRSWQEEIFALFAADEVAMQEHDPEYKENPQVLDPARIEGFDAMLNDRLNKFYKHYHRMLDISSAEELHTPEVRAAMAEPMIALMYKGRTIFRSLGDE